MQGPVFFAIRRYNSHRDSPWARLLHRHSPNGILRVTARSLLSDGFETVVGRKSFTSPTFREEECSAVEADVSSQLLTASAAGRWLSMVPFLARVRADDIHSVGRKNIINARTTSRRERFDVDRVLASFITLVRHPG